MTFVFEASVAALERASEVLNRALAEAGCPVKASTKLMIAFDEIASNIVRYSGAPDFSVDIDFPENPSAVRISFSDSGRAFNPLVEAPSPDTTLPAERREVGGLGLFMVRKMMDFVTYSHENGRNVLTISKLRD